MEKAKGVEVLLREAARRENGFGVVAPIPIFWSSLRVPPASHRSIGHSNWCQLADGHFLASCGSVLRLFAVQEALLVVKSEFSCQDDIHFIRRDPTGRCAVVQVGLSNAVIWCLTVYF